MEIINESQRPPFVLVCCITFLTIAGSYFITRYIDPSPSTSNLVYWYMARAAGMTSYCLLSGSVLLGLSSSNGIWDKWRLRKLMVQMHQYFSLLVFPFLFFHLWGLRQDSSVPFAWNSLLIPFIDKYRPLPTGFGILVLYGWAVIMATSYLRDKIGAKAWRTFHYISLPMFVGVTIHGLLTGTDTGKYWSTVVYMVPSFMFVWLAWRKYNQ